MPDSINFVRDQRKKLSKHQAQDKVLFKFAMIALIVAFTIFLLAVSVRVYLSLQVRQLTQQQEQQRGQIQAQESQERQYLLFAAKLEALSQLFINRRNKQEAINYFSTLFGDDVLISDINYNAETGELGFGLLTRNVFSLDRVMDTLRSSEVQSQFTSLTFNDLIRSPVGEYQTNIQVVLKSELENE